MRRAGALTWAAGCLAVVAAALAAVFGLFPVTFRGLAELCIALAVGVYLAVWGRNRWDGAGQITDHDFERDVYTHYCSYRLYGRRLCLRQRWEHER